MKDNQIFVFGANAQGIHGKGSALQARKFGTANGEAVNSLSANGKTWGIVTKDSPYGSKVSKNTLINNINNCIKTPPITNVNIVYDWDKIYLLEKQNILILYWHIWNLSIL